MRAQKPSSGVVVSKDEIVRALDAGATAIYSDVGLWEAAIAELTQEVARHLAQRISVSAYLGGAGLAPHNDNQCSLVLQVQGTKRWRLWTKSAAMLPVGGGSLLFGRTKSCQIEAEKLGEPYLDVELQPGEMLYIPRGTITETSPSIKQPSADRSLHLTVRIHVLLADEEAVDVGTKPAPLAKVIAMHSVGQTIDRPITARSPVPHPQTGKDYVQNFWDLYLQAANEVVLADAKFRFSLDFSTPAALNRSKELLRPLYKQVLNEVIDGTQLIDGFGGLANSESQQWYEARRKQQLGSQRGREGAYKLEAAALAGMGEGALGLWLYGQACQPTTCVQGVHPLHRDLAPHVSVPFPPLSPLPAESAWDDAWSGSFSRAFRGMYAKTVSLFQTFDTKNDDHSTKTGSGQA